MPETYQTEDEQIEAIKKWWKENGKSTLVSILLALAIVFGWQGYQKRRVARIDTASALFQNMVAAVDASGGRPTKDQLITAAHLADNLKKEFPDSTYAQFAALYKAQIAVNAKHLDRAETELRWALKNASQPEIQLQVKLRLARVLYGEKKYDEALKMLQGKAEGYAAGFEELKGDIFKAQGKNSEALAAYQKATDINRSADKPVPNPVLKLKLEQLKSATGDAKTGAADA